MSSPSPLRSQRRGWMLPAFIALIIGGFGGLVVGVNIDNDSDTPQPTTSISPRPTPVPTQGGTVRAADRCPAVGSEAYTKAVHKTGLHEVSGVLGKRLVVVGSVNVNEPPVVVVVRPGAVLKASVVVCGPNARIVIYPNSTFAHDGSVVFVAKGTEAQVVVADDALPDGKTLHFAATAGLAACSTSTALPPGVPACTNFVPPTKGK